MGIKEVHISAGLLTAERNAYTIMIVEVV